MHTVSLWVAHLSLSLEFSSVSNYLASLASLHQFHDFPAPNIEHFAIKQALAGIERMRTEAPNGKSALLPNHSFDIHSLLIYFHTTFVGPFGVRVCLPSTQSYVGQIYLKNISYLCFWDIAQEGTSIIIKVPVIKTSRSIASQVTHPLEEILESPPCPVKAFKRLKKVTGIKQSTAILLRRQRGEDTQSRNVCFLLA